MRTPKHIREYEETSKLSEMIIKKINEINSYIEPVRKASFEKAIKRLGVKNMLQSEVIDYLQENFMSIVETIAFERTETGVNFEILVWVKTNPTPATNNVWLPDVEYCLYFREKGVKLNDGYELKSKWFISPLNTDDKKYFGHPTIKPLELVKRHLLHATQEGDLVADFFLGSGTTAVACKENRRNYLGYEINEAYFKIAEDRLKGINQHGQMNLFYQDE